MEHFLDCCNDDSTWEVIQLDHTIIKTTKGLKCKQPGFFKLPNEVFQFLNRSSSQIGKICLLRFIELMMKYQRK